MTRLRCGRYIHTSKRMTIELVGMGGIVEIEVPMYIPSVDDDELPTFIRRRL